MDHQTAPSRRDFLKTSSAAAGAVLAGKVRQSPGPPTRPAAMRSKSP